ncbi:MAG: ABC transporter permease [Acidobacteriota bacterium]
MERLRQDVRYAARILWRDRGFALTALLTLGICIGANAAIFAIVNSVLLRPLPVPEADRLVLLYNSYPRAGVERGSTGVPDYFDRLRETDAFEEQTLYRVQGQTIGGEADPQRLTGMSARPSLFRLLRTTPLRGRLFGDQEGELGHEHAVVLSYPLWQELFSGSDSALGRDLRINGVPHTIVGVMPERFAFMDPDVKLWTPMAFTAEQKSDDARHSNSWTMVARLKKGATVRQAQQQVDALNLRNLDRFSNMKEILINAGFHTVVTSLQEDLVREVRPTLYLLWGGVLFVLAIGAVNITNLVLIRSSSRRRELATRHALGAALSRLTRQLLTETVLLTLAGGILGVGVGYAGLSLLAGAGFESLPRSQEIRMDLPAIGFTLALALIVGLAVGLVPVFNLRRMNLSQAFREEGRSGTSTRGARALRRVLVASQVAFAFMLLIGAGLLLASFERVLAVSPGFDPSHVLTAHVSPPASRYAEDPALRTFADRLLGAVQGLPGVKGAGIASNIPFGGDFDDSVILAEGYAMAPGESLISPYRVTVTPGYLEALAVPLHSGRRFNDSDTETAPRVVIVDDRLARKFWPGVDPIGRRMYQPENSRDILAISKDTKWITVVGVVGETKMAGLVTSETRVGTYYFPVRQQPIRSMTLAIKTDGAPEAVTAAIRQQLHAIDPELPLYGIRTMEARIQESVADRRTPMLVAMVFGIVALFLAAVGIYGVLAYQVSQRRKEIGIRMALGSDARGIFALVIREGMGLLATGVVAGLAGAFLIRRTIQSQLYDIGAMDPRVLAAVAAMLVLVALTACTVPARRAARIDPMTALGEQ